MIDYQRYHDSVLEGGEPEPFVNEYDWDKVQFPDRRHLNLVAWINLNYYIFSVLFIILTGMCSFVGNS